MHNVLLYDKGRSGHRGRIQDLLRKHFRVNSSTVTIFEANENSKIFDDLTKLKKQYNISHCHVLTLADVIDDFQEPRNLDKFKSLNITLSATLYQIQLWPKPLSILKSVTRKALSGFPSRSFTLFKLLSCGVIQKVAVPDERISSIFRYPLFRDKLIYLPDPILVNMDITAETRRVARDSLSLSSSTPTLLMFGTMNKYKGLEVLLEAISSRYDSLYRKINKKMCAIVAGRWNDKPRIFRPSKYVNLIVYNQFIPENQARALFAASDCVVMPFLRQFRHSSGNFSLACAAGKFVIVPNHGLLAFRVKRLENGLTFKAEQPESLAKVICQFVKKHGTLSTSDERSLSYARNCTPDTYSEMLGKVIESCLNDG